MKKNQNLMIAAVLLIASHVAFATTDADSSSPVSVEQDIKVERQETSWLNSIARVTLGGAAVAYQAVKYVTPAPVKTVLGYAAKPVKMLVSKVTGWNNIWDFLADEKSSIRWMTSNVLLGRMCGFSSGETASKETKLIAQTMLLTKGRVLAQMKKEAFPKEAEYDAKMKELYGCLKTPKSFSINVAVYLAETVLGRVMPSMTPELIEFAAGNGLKHLTVKNLKACTNLLVKYIYLKQKMSMSSNSLVSNGGDMLQGYNLYNKIQADFARDRAKKQADALREARKNQKASPVTIKIEPRADDYVPPMPKIEVLKKSGARAAMDLWVFLLVALLVASVLFMAWNSGMRKAPTSNFPTHVGGGVEPRCTSGPYDLPQSRNLEQEFSAQDMV